MVIKIKDGTKPGKPVNYKEKHWGSWEVHWEDSVVVTVVSKLAISDIIARRQQKWNNLLLTINLLSKTDPNELKFRMDLLGVINTFNISLSWPLQAPMEGIAILHQFPFSSGLQRMSVVSQKIGEEHYDLYMKGAPEIVSSLCRQETGIEWGKGNFTVFIWT